MSTRLVADVGGTNTRLALFDPATQEFRALATYVNRDYASFQAVIAAWLDSLPEATPSACCIAIAAAPSDDVVVMANMDWSFSCRELARQFGFARFGRINDFEAIGYALAHLGDDDRQLLHDGQGAGTTFATVGPGTGLGGATLDTRSKLHRVDACEPGHMSLSPVTDLELDLFRLLLPRYANIYAELLVSGPGLVRLYEGLGEIHGTGIEPHSPAEVSQRALAAEDSLCTLALNTFCALLGSICGDFVLANGAYGGLYLAGGILPGMIEFLLASEFQSRLTAKGVMQAHLDALPVHVITTAQPGLIGAANAPL